MILNGELKAFILFFAILMSDTGIAQSAQTKTLDTAEFSDTEIIYPYKLFPTTNIWTHILIDTETGRAWQVHFSMGDDSQTGKLPINDISLLPQGAPVRGSRFTLSPTQNMYTFLLLDRQDGRVWQLQWSLEEKSRGIVRVISETKQQP